jgi:hypothetical protein
MGRGRTFRGVALFAVAVVAASALSASAMAGSNRYQLHRTAAGQSAARAVVLIRSDLGKATGWSGGFVKPDMAPDPGCPNYRPKVSDLVITGTAAAQFDHAGLEFHSESQVLKTAKMVRLDWQRTINTPNFISCASANLKQSMRKSPSERFISLARVLIPQIATYTEAYRATIDVKTGGKTVRMASDLVVVGRGRTEISLMTTTALAAIPTVWKAELALAARLLARSKA